MTTNPRYSVAGLACIALAGASLNATAQQAPSSAQNTAADSDQLAEITVTASERPPSRGTCREPLS